MRSQIVVNDHLDGRLIEAEVAAQDLVPRDDAIHRIVRAAEDPGSLARGSCW